MQSWDIVDERKVIEGWSIQSWTQLTGNNSGGGRGFWKNEQGVGYYKAGDRTLKTQGMKVHQAGSSSRGSWP